MSPPRLFCRGVRRARGGSEASVNQEVPDREVQGSEEEEEEEAGTEPVPKL